MHAYWDIPPHISFTHWYFGKAIWDSCPSAALLYGVDPHLKSSPTDSWRQSYWHIPTFGACKRGTLRNTRLRLCCSNVKTPSMLSLFKWQLPSQFRSMMDMREIHMKWTENAKKRRRARKCSRPRGHGKLDGGLTIHYFLFTLYC